METGEFAVPPPPALPERLAGRYALLERLGGGSSAEVWRGRDDLLGREVAAKVLHRHLLIDAPARTRFEQEARAVARLAHPGIVPVYDVAADEIGAAMILENVPGWSLAALLRKHGRLPAQEAVRIAAEIAEALSHAHDRGVIHRDVKPGNVLIDETGRARLADFGIARVLGEEASRVTAAGTITGTLMYLAPEQLAGHDVDPRADLYGAGLVLYEMLVGEPVYRVTTPVALAEAQRTPPSVVPGVDPMLSAVVRRAIEPDRDRRYPAASTLARDLRAWLRDGERAFATAAAGAPTMVDRAATDPPDTGGPAYGTVPGAATALRPTGRRGRPWWLAPIAILITVAASALLLSGFTGGIASPSPSERPGGSVVRSASPRPSSSVASTTPVRSTASPSASGSPPPSPSPSLSPSTSPTSSTFSAAMTRLRDLIRDGQERRAIAVRAGDELLVDTNDIAKAVREERYGQARQHIVEFRRSITEMERDERIREPEFARQLRQAVNAVESAIRG